MSLRGSEHREVQKGSGQVFRDLWKTSRHYYVNSLDQAILYSQVTDLFKFEWLENILPQGCGIRSLECGCGSAGASAYFAEGGYGATVIDLTDTGVKKARESFGRYSLTCAAIQGDVLSLPFTENSFDVVMSFGLLEHFEEPENAVREMIRVLKPGGTFFAEICPKKVSVQTFANFFVNGLATFIYWTLHRRPVYGVSKGVRKIFSFEDFYESTYPLSRYERGVIESGVPSTQCVSANPFPDIYFPRFLMPAWVRWLKSHQGTWDRFVGPKSRLAQRWNRFWYLWAQKPARGNTAAQGAPKSSA